MPEIPNLALLAPVLAAECRDVRRCAQGGRAVNALRWYAVIGAAVGAAVGAAGLPIFQVMSPPGLPAKSQDQLPL